MGPSTAGWLRNERLRWRLGLALVALPICMQVLFVGLVGVNSLAWDELYYVPFAREVLEGGDWLRWMAIQHNEHRVVPMKLAMVPMILWTHWNAKAGMYLSAGLAALLVWGLWKLYRRIGGRDLLIFAPVSFLVANLAQYENMLMGMMTCHYFTAVGMIWALVGLANGTVLGVVAAALAAGVASFSILGGMVVWPIGLGCLLVQRRRGAALLWAVAAAVAAWLHFHHYDIPPAAPMPRSLDALARSTRYLVTLLGGPLSAQNTAWALVLGLALLVLLARCVVAWPRSARSTGLDVYPAAVVLIGLATVAMIAFGRRGMISPLQSRYVLYASLVLIGAHLFLGREQEARREGAAPWFLGSTLLLVLGLAAADLKGMQQAIEVWRPAQLLRQFQMQTFEQQPDEVLAGLYVASEVRPSLTYLRAQALGPFAEPRSVQVVIRWREGVVAGEILPASPVEQTFVCSVGSLRDVGVVFSTFGRVNTGHVSLSLFAADDRQLATSTVSAGPMVDGGWVKLAVEPPLADCAGQRLRLRIESADARPGEAVTVWTYPPALDGRLEQAGNPAVDGRALGMALNAFWGRLVPEANAG